MASARWRRSKTPIRVVESPLRDLVIELVSKSFSPVGAVAMCAREDALGCFATRRSIQASTDCTLGLNAAACLRSGGS